MMKSKNMPKEESVAEESKVAGHEWITGYS